MAKHFKDYLMPDEMWERLEPLVPHYKIDPRGGRPRKKDFRRIADGIFYRFRTSCQWNLLPRYFGTSSTLHRYFQEWVDAGVFEKLWIVADAEYDELN